MNQAAALARKKRLPRPEIGAVYGHLTYVGLGRFTDRQFFAFRCECGKSVESELRPVHVGRVKSCGCFNRARFADQARTHGMSRTPEAGIWACMRNRCANPNASGYENYGGRGIAVDQAWDSFEQFYLDMGPRPSKRHTLDRIDNDKGYSAKNCRWATPREQIGNRRNTIKLTAYGETKPLSEWARSLGVPYRRLAGRMERGWTGESVLSPRPGRKSANSAGSVSGRHS